MTKIPYFRPEEMLSKEQIIQTKGGIEPIGRATNRRRRQAFIYNELDLVRDKYPNYQSSIFSLVKEKKRKISN